MRLGNFAFSFKSVYIHCTYSGLQLLQQIITRIRARSVSRNGAERYRLVFSRWKYYDISTYEWSCVSHILISVALCNNSFMWCNYYSMIYVFIPWVEWYRVRRILKTTVTQDFNMLIILRYSNLLLKPDTSNNQVISFDTRNTICYPKPKNSKTLFT